MHGGVSLFHAFHSKISKEQTIEFICCIAFFSCQFLSSTRLQVYGIDVILLPKCISDHLPFVQNLIIHFMDVDFFPLSGELVPAAIYLWRAIHMTMR